MFNISEDNICCRRSPLAYTASKEGTYIHFYSRVYANSCFMKHYPKSVETLMVCHFSLLYAVHTLRTIHLPYLWMRDDVETLCVEEGTTFVYASCWFVAGRSCMSTLYRSSYFRTICLSSIHKLSIASSFTCAPQAVCVTSWEV